jgi:2-iminobutanoate/2-iminopropanoate deaminase
MKKEISTPNAPSAPVFLSQAIDTGSLVFIAGQVYQDTSGQLVPAETVEEKLVQIFSNIKAILEAAELGLEDVVKATIYVTDMAQMPEINKFYPTYFTAPFPAREAIGVQALPLGATIEISVIAAR